MNILAKARRLESTLARSLDHAARRFAKAGTRQPLEIAHAIVHAVEARVEPAGRGAHVFPFNRIKVIVLASNRETRTRFEAVLSEAPSIEQRICERLRVAGCEPEGLHVKTTYVTHAEPYWASPEFHLEFDRVTVTAPPPAPEQPLSPRQLRLSIVAGRAQESSYAFTLARINIGRCAEVRDSHHRLIRTNDVAFADNGDANHTVSRRHAHIDYHASSREHRVCDDGSAHGTSVIRHGRTIPVPTGSRGIRLQPGDEIILGDARVAVQIDAE